MNIVKILWFALGIVLLGIAYVGIFLPGLPWSTPAVCAAYCFAKSSTRMHNWIYSHKIFGPFLIGWKRKENLSHKSKVLYGNYYVLVIGSYVVYYWKSISNIIYWYFYGTSNYLGMEIPRHRKRTRKQNKEGKRIAWLKMKRRKINAQEI